MERLYSQTKIVDGDLGSLLVSARKYDNLVKFVRSYGKKEKEGRLMSGVNELGWRNNKKIDIENNWERGCLNKIRR